MGGEIEVAVTSDASGQLWNSCVWDASTGTALMTLKGGVAAPRTLSFLSLDYVLAAEKTKPLLQLWHFGRNDFQQRVVCPGKVSALATSPGGSYCVFGIQEKIYVWQLASSRICSVLTHHYQAVKVLRFTDDGSHFVSGAEDGLVLTWPIVAAESSRGQNPRFVWDHHTLPVMDIYVGSGGLSARVVTASLDQTCKVYSLRTGQLLVSVIFDVALTSVTMNCCDTSVLVGTSNGFIYDFQLQNPPRTIEHHFTREEQSSCVFAGHTKAVTCLSTSMDGTMLLSGSDDATAIVWDVQSHQCLRILPHKGPVSNAVFRMGFVENRSCQITLPSKLKLLETPESESLTVEVLIQQPRSLVSHFSNGQPEPKVDVASTVHLEKYKQANKDLYDFYVSKLMQPCKASILNKMHTE